MTTNEAEQMVCMDCGVPDGVDGPLTPAGEIDGTPVFTCGGCAAEMTDSTGRVYSVTAIDVMSSEEPGRFHLLQRHEMRCLKAEIRHLRAAINAHMAHCPAGEHTPESSLPAAG